MNVQCELCPKGCIIAPGQSGECRIRVNVGGRLLALTYGRPCAVHPVAVALAGRAPRQVTMPDAFIAAGQCMGFLRPEMLVEQAQFHAVCP
mgnify:CR=1 FL=1